MKKTAKFLSILNYAINFNLRQHPPLMRHLIMVNIVIMLGVGELTRLILIYSDKG